MKTKDSKEVGEGATLSFSWQSSASRLHCYFQIALQEMRDGFLDPCEHPDSSRLAFSLPLLLCLTLDLFWNHQQPRHLRGSYCTYRLPAHVGSTRTPGICPRGGGAVKHQRLAAHLHCPAAAQHWGRAVQAQLGALALPAPGWGVIM